MERHPHILNASSNLLGICFILITSLKLTGSNEKSWADEISWGAALLFLAATVLSYFAVRHPTVRWCETWADRAFIAALFVLFTAVLVGAIYL